MIAGDVPEAQVAEGQVVQVIGQEADAQDRVGGDEAGLEAGIGVVLLVQAVRREEAEEMMRGWYAMDADAPEFDDVWREAAESDLTEYGTSDDDLAATVDAVVKETAGLLDFLTKKGDD